MGLYPLYRIHLHPVLSAHDDHRQPCRKCDVKGVPSDWRSWLSPRQHDPSWSADIVDIVGRHFDVISSPADNDGSCDAALSRA